MSSAWPSAGLSGEQRDQTVTETFLASPPLQSVWRAAAEDVFHPESKPLHQWAADRERPLGDDGKLSGLTGSWRAETQGGERQRGAGPQEEKELGREMKLKVGTLRVKSLSWWAQPSHLILDVSTWNFSIVTFQEMLKLEFHD